MMKGFPNLPRIAETNSVRKRVRFLRSQPYSSVRRFDQRD